MIPASASLRAAAVCLLTALLAGAALVALGSAAVPVVAVQATAFAVVMLVLGWLRRDLLRSRDALAAQVEAVSRGRLVERPQADAKEWEPLSKALNTMVARLKAGIAEREQRYEELQSSVSRDALTGLATRAQWVQLLENLLERPDAQSGGIVLLRIDDLAGLNQRLGRDRGDELLCTVATLLSLRAARLGGQGEVLVARLNGVDFAVLVRRCDSDQLDQWTRDLVAALAELKSQGHTDRPHVGWLAAVLCHPGEAFGAVMGRVDHELLLGEGAGVPWHRVRTEPGAPPISTARWRQLIDEALATGRVQLAFAPATCADGSASQRLATIRLALDDAARAESVEVVSAALRTGRSAALELRAVQLALVAAAEGEGDVALRLSAQTLRHPSFASRLNTLLATAPDASRRLCLEVAVEGDESPADMLRPLAEVLRQHGVRLGLDQVRMLPEDLAALRGMGLSYLRLAPTLCRNLDGSAAGGRLRMVKTLVQYASDEGVAVLAGAVSGTGEAALLEQLGVRSAPPPHQAYQPG